MATPLPPPTDPRWAGLILGKAQPDFLGAKVMIGRWSAAYRQTPTASTLAAACTELHDLYAQLAHLPKIQADLARLFA